MTHDIKYPLSKLQFGVEELTKTYERLLGPLHLFAPLSDDGVAKEKKFELERPVTPVNNEIKKAPQTLSQLAQFVRRRLTARSNVPHLTSSNQQQLADVIMAAVNTAWPSIQSLAEDPTLTREDNRELLRRIAVHVVTVCQTLYEHYLLQAEILNNRGVFSSEANMTRLKTQLAIDANKFLNVLVIRRYILADLTRSSSDGPATSRCDSLEVQSPGRPQPRKNKLPSHVELIQATHVQKTVAEISEDSMQRTIEQMLREMPTLNMEKLHETLALLPEVSRDVTTDMTRTALPEPATTDSKVCADRKTSQELSQEKVLLKRSKSITELMPGESLADELDLHAADRKRFSSAVGHDVKVTGEARRIDKLQEQSKLSRRQEDLQRLMTVNKDSGEELDDLAPLLQAVVQSVKHDNRLERIKAELQMLEERERQREEQERLVLPESEHVQPSTVTKQFSNKVCVRTSDMRVSERTCIMPLSLRGHTMLYNDLNNEIDSTSVKEMDRRLCLEDEIGVIYDELMKTMTKDHLDLDVDSSAQPTVDDVNLSKALASSSLAKSRQERIINRQLQQSAQQIQSAVTNDRNQLNAQVRAQYAKTGKIKSHSSWLSVWKETVNSDDYIKYLSSKETDYMAAMFHLYNSDDESAAESDDETNPSATPSRRQNSQADEQNEKLAELRALKSEYQTGLWNVNSVMLGGLGKDPDIENTGAVGVSSRSLQQLNPSVAATSTSSQSYIVNKKQRRLAQERLEQEIIAASQKVVEIPVQDRLEVIWSTLQMPESQKLDMALKYSCDKYNPLLNEVVDKWQTAADLVTKREELIKRLESFERTASRPSRLVNKDISTIRLKEEETRSAFNKKISAVDALLKKLLTDIQNQYDDVISYQGRPYLDKMRNDRLEMLYWLQEERKIGALHHEARARCLPPLSASATAIQPLPSS